jgi:hypothetical protein
MLSSLSRRWLIANAIGLVVGFPLFGFVADEIVDHDGPLDIPLHLVGFLAFAAVLSFLQRWAIGARHTSYPWWIVLQGVSVFLLGGIAFELVGPPLDFVANVVALGASTGLLLRWEASKAGGVRPRWMVAKGAAAGLASLVGMIPVFLVAESVDSAVGGGAAGFMVILSLIGLVSGVAIGTLLRPPVATVPAPAAALVAPSAR